MDKNRIGPVKPNSQIEVTVMLRRKSEEGLPTLDAFLDGERASGITRQILADRYGSRAEDATAVETWAKSKHLSVSSVDLARRQLHLTGSAEAMEKAFQAKLSMYNHPRTGTHHCRPEGEVKIPCDVAKVIIGVFGLNDMPAMVRPAASRKIPHRADQGKADPKTLFPGCFYPHEVAELYDFPDTKGANQRVAVLEFGGGFDRNILDSYFRDKIKPPVSPTVNVIPVLNQQMQLNDPLTAEVYLDIEIIGAMAPRATIDVYFAPWSVAGFLNALTKAIHQHDYAAISISYGLDEDIRDRANPDWESLHEAIDEAFRDAAAIGVPLFIATGDQGSGSDGGFLDSGRGPRVTVKSATTHAEYPASSPYATAVGGTLLYPKKEDGIRNEVVWNELGPFQQGKLLLYSGAIEDGVYYVGGATGGGVSDHYAVPSYQSNAGIQPQSANPKGKAGRGIPDVAGNAGLTTGYLVSRPPGSPQPIAPGHGTSAGPPMWAALMACVREALEARFGEKVPTFFLNDFVYAVGHSNAFHHIVGGREFTLERNELSPAEFIPTGNNRSSRTDGYYATKGHDLCTGWGTPNGKALLAELEAWLKGRRHQSARSSGSPGSAPG
jgi:kumamolisin